MYYTETNVSKNSSTFENMYISLKKLKFNLQFTFLTGFSDNYIMLLFFFFPLKNSTK